MIDDDLTEYILPNDTNNINIQFFLLILLILLIIFVIQFLFYLFGSHPKHDERMYELGKYV